MDIDVKITGFAAFFSRFAQIFKPNRLTVFYSGGDFYLYIFIFAHPPISATFRAFLFGNFPFSLTFRTNRNLLECPQDCPPRGSHLSFAMALWALNFFRARLYSFTMAFRAFHSFIKLHLFFG